MNKTICKIIFLVGIIISPFFSENVYACQCNGMRSLFQEFSDSKTVFAGKVLDLKTEKESIYTFQVTESFKGALTPQIKVSTGTPNMCESGFVVGKSYLLYANSSSEGDFYTHNFCSRNEDLDFAQGEIALLRDLAQGKPLFQLSGSVIRKDTDFTENKIIGTPLENIKIMVESKDKTFSVLTDKKGLFRLNNLPKGIYTIKPEVPEKYQETTGYPPQDRFIVFKSGKIVSLEDFSTPSEEEMLTEEVFALIYKKPSEGEAVNIRFIWNNSVKGRILDSEGKELTDVDVKLIPINSNIRQIKSDEDRKFNKDYSLWGITPGDYFLAAEINNPFKGKEKTTIFYPQAETLEKSSVIKIKENDNLNFDLILPVIKTKLDGNVFWEDGTQISGDVSIILTGAENPTVEEMEKKKYDFDRLDGASDFSLNGYIGSEYWVQVLVYAEEYVNDVLKTTEIRSKPIKVILEKTNKPLRILISKPDNQ